jgi:predicted nucleic acid-binding protein
MNVVDSSAWLEYFADGPNAAFFARPIERTAELVVPSLTIYEVFKRILQQRDEGAALRAVAVVQQGTVVERWSRVKSAPPRARDDVLSSRCEPGNPRHMRDRAPWAG